MTSKSFSSKGLLGNSMRRSLWALVLSGVGFFLSLLLPALMTMQNALEQRVLDLKEIPQAHVEINWQNAMNNAASMLSGGNLFVKIVFIVLAVVCGVAMSPICTPARRLIFITACRFRAHGCLRTTF